MVKYKTFIAEQIRLLSEAEAEVPVPKKVRNKDPDAMHIGSTKAGHHVFLHGDTDRGETSYFSVQHPDGKRITHHHVEHGGTYGDELPSKKELATKSSLHNVHNLHPDVRDIIHDHIHSEFND